MSSFEVKVRRVEVVPHPNADNLEIGLVDGYQSIIAKGSMKTGDLAVYIPEQAIVPDVLLKDIGLVGKLAGPEKNRVKAIKLRGVVSQGLLYRSEWFDIDLYEEGCEVGELLGIKKWKPEIPTHLAGEQEACPGIFTYTDIESVQKFTDMFQDGDQVRMTEKLHGSCMIVGIIEGKRVVSSKGLAGRGIVIKESDENAYWRAAKAYGLHEKLEDWYNDYPSDIILFGELLGVQDLKYGLEPGEVGFRAFDVWQRDAGYASPFEFGMFCNLYDIPTVPTLYQGPYSLELAQQYASGQSTLASHIREGVVIRPTMEQTDHHGRRKVGKLVSPEYLTRKGDATEFE